MTLSRLDRPSTPIEVSVLAVMALVLGAGCVASAAFPLSDDAPRALMVGFGSVGLAVAAGLLIGGARVAPAVLHGAIILLTVMRGVMVAVAATERGLMLSALGYVWTAVYVAYCFRPGVARSYATLMTVALGVSMLLARAPSAVSVWMTICAMIWVAIAVLTNLNTRLRTEAHCDGLTGLLNRTGFAAAGARLRATSDRHGEPVAIAVIDLDDFKAVNDRHGHSAGDRLLIDLAAAWTSALRQSDLLARFGGDEFVLMVAVTTEEEIEGVLERLRDAHPAQWTAGAVLCAREEPLYAAIDRADAVLYGAKSRLRAAV